MQKLISDKRRMHRWPTVLGLPTTMVLLGALIFSVRAVADGQAFSVDATAPAGDAPEAQTSSVGGMKYRAVVEWLQRYLGNRYGQFEKLVTPDFAEKYILDYKVGHVPTNHALIEVTGHLDSESLKRWVRVNEARGDGALRPLFVLSSTIPGMTISPNDTVARVHDSSFAQSLLGYANAAVAKFNSHAVPFAGNNLSLSQPPRTEAEVHALREQVNGKTENSVIWIHLTPCGKTCSGVRMGTYLYNLGQGERLALIRSDELNLSAEDFASGEKVKSALKTPIHQFQSDVDEAISQGTLFGTSHHVVVEGIENYRIFQQIDLELPKLDYLTQCVLKRSEPKVAEFEVLTGLSAEELYQRLGAEDFPGFRLKPVRVDSSTLVVRYWNTDHIPAKQ